MKKVFEEKDNLIRLIKMISNQFGDKCEVVLHDLTEDYNHTIVAIENSHVTGRKVGDCGSNLGLEVLRGKNSSGDRYNYKTQLKDGRFIRSSTVHLKDDDDKIIGAICVNYDITNFLITENILKGFTDFPTDSKEDTEIFANNVNELLDYLIQECQKIIAKPVSVMTKNDKIRAVEYLDSKGAFLITKSGDRVCDYLKVSKYTLYNFLDIARKN